MWPKTLYFTRGNASMRVHSQEQIARMGPGWELREPPEPTAMVEAASEVADALAAPAPVVRAPRPRGRPRSKR